MGIVSNLPFSFTIIRRYPNFNKFAVGEFFDTEQEAWETEEGFFQIEENEEVEVKFNSEDNLSKLYLEALDIVPPKEDEVFSDDNGQLYRKPSDKPFFLYKIGNEYDALCVDRFLIKVVSGNHIYYSTLQVSPKPFSKTEWTMMRDDLEKEITGLAQDLIRRNLGLGASKEGKLPPKILHDFIIMQKYSKRILPALLDISENPRCQIITRYKKVIDTKNSRLDERSVRRYISRAGSESFYQVPEKVINYDIQDNRILKMILQNYQKRLNEFIEVMNDTTESELIERGSEQYKSEWSKSINNFKDEAFKLKKITSFINMKAWYSSLSEVASPFIPHSFFMDSRYNILYQMHNEMHTNSFKIDFDPEYSYTWKKSSYLYEMWCFIKICRILEKSFTNISGDLVNIFISKMLFPFIHAGSKVEFTNNELKLVVLFDRTLGYKSEETSLSDPLYMAHSSSNRHNRPDILINAYDKHSGWYLGSVVLECKYRKINSFWGNNEWSSVQQFEAYYNNSRSKFLYGGKAFRTMLPVNRVIVLTPDQNGDGKKLKDFNVEVRGLKPSDDDAWLNALNSQLLGIIEEMKENAQSFLS
jgi:hypothetical protein